MFLEDLGCESSLIFQDTSGQVYNLQVDQVQGTLSYAWILTST